MKGLLNGMSFLWGMVFWLGASVGSFLNVCMDRVPRGESVVKPRSFCRGCGYGVRWYDNIPVVSWLVLRGRCRVCKVGIGVRTLVVEVLSGVILMVLVGRYGVGMGVVWGLWVSMMMVVVGIDWDYFMIPDGLTVGGFCLGVVLSGVFPEMQGEGERVWGVVYSLVSGFVCSGILLWVAILGEWVMKREAMGFGDVKLVGMMGTFAGWKVGLLGIFGGAVLGVVGYGLVKVFRRWVKFGRGLEGSGEVITENMLPYGTFIGIAGIIGVVFPEVLRFIEGMVR